jgi:hypothetical protein
MAEKPTQPLYSGGNPSFPLSESPFFSRTEDKNVRFTGEDELSQRKNYQFVAYRPGFSLQASELNEMQENMQMQMSLSISMMHNWITSGTGYLWNGWSSNAPGGEGDAWDGYVNDLPPNTGIGIGGSINTPHDPKFAISGPGWKGATPLYPFASPYQGDSSVPMVQVIEASDIKSKIKFNPGWYLVEARDWWNGELDQQPSNVSGLKHWVYLDDDTIEEEILYNSEDNRNIVVGLVVESGIMNCCSEIEDCDDTLADNASGFPNSASCGASRYRITITESDSVIPGFDNHNGGDWGNQTDGESPFADRERMNPVCVINPVNKTIRYMNNLLLHQW